MQRRIVTTAKMVLRGVSSARSRKNSDDFYSQGFEAGFLVVAYFLSLFGSSLLKGGAP